jgi:beta-lactam-binding protein with PASTA domain
MSLLACSIRSMRGAAIGFAFFMAVSLLAACGDSGRTTVPDVTPNYAPEAIAKLHEVGLEAEIQLIPPISKADLGVNGHGVARQVPAAGTRVAHGSSVRLTVQISENLGPGGLGTPTTTGVPNLIGLDINRAILLARQAGLRATVIPPERTLDDLVVKSQSLRPGAHVEQGTEIDLILA